MPKTAHWLSLPAIACLALSALASAYTLSRPDPGGWLFWLALAAPLLVWFVAARQVQDAVEARNAASDALSIVKHIAEVAGVNANQPPEILVEAIADQDTANRNAVINQLTQVYVLMHREASQRIIEGSEPPPLEWLNEGLEKLGVSWRVRTTSSGELESYTP